MKLSEKFFEQPNFEYQHLERALPILCKENDFIQSELYKNSKKYMPRNNHILYYDCTNFFFEIECEDDFRKYGKSKENRPNPIVQMGLFMDGNGIPLSCEITPGNTNEQVTLKPLEEKIIKRASENPEVLKGERMNLSKLKRLMDEYISGKDITIKVVLLREFSKELGELLEEPKVDDENCIKMDSDKINENI